MLRAVAFLAAVGAMMPLTHGFSLSRAVMPAARGLRAPLKCTSRAPLGLKMAGEAGDTIDFGKVGFDEATQLSGMVFQPEQGTSEPESRCRVDWDVRCEKALNDHINVEYTASYAYHSLFAYFDRDTVALKGFAAFMDAQSKEERGHAHEFMEYQNARGGQVVLKPYHINVEYTASYAYHSLFAYFDRDTVALKGFAAFMDAQSKEERGHAHEFMEYQNARGGQVVALNDHINVEYTASYAYHSLFAYFDRDTVALKGFAAFMDAQSKEERGHAHEFMEYQNARGGQVVLKPVAVPEMQFSRVDGTSDALYAMELALQLEKFVYRKLKALHVLGEECSDPEFCDKIEQYLGEQVDAIKSMAEYVAQIRRLGTGHGVWHMDKELMDAAAA
eukprot:CAMPEP_0114143084 /NCGR_PEP_ID=MMETSP0043_2-20121206/18793_1 /TAXON_ID=464988 /ORGANISM="Hemiselmis andersenii, Strain CCMP644" /LENGTH=388 /DNA_ID=CAMNT_0001237349 /DNA_START=27 /DNA_END=1195 /DNA_ORIENTATION=+